MSREGWAPERPDDYWHENVRLDAQNKELRAEIERLRAAEDHDLRCKKSLRVEVERLTRANAELRAVLKSIEHTANQAAAMAEPKP
jgi:hypothetical protein